MIGTVVLVAADTEPDSTNASSGFLGFVVFFLLALAVWFLVRNMTARLRRMNYAEQEQIQPPGQPPQNQDQDNLRTPGQPPQPPGTTAPPTQPDATGPAGDPGASPTGHTDDPAAGPRP